MRLEPSSFRYLTKDDIRLLTSVEMGLKNHEYVPEQLIESIAQLRRSGVFPRLQVLIKHKLLFYQGGKVDGYKLTYNGYDCLALRALTNRGVVSQVGSRIGVGKESDIHTCTNDDHQSLVIKFHRLGRISFRTVKTNRDYLDGRSHASWLYLARLAAKKEFQYMQALYEHGFPVPKPIDNNRHAVVMEYMVGSVPLNQLPSDLPETAIESLLNQIFTVLLRFASAGLIHGDFNEFNLLVDLHDVRKVTVIDFPQIISMTHSEAKNQFDRDVSCVTRFFSKRFRYNVECPPNWDDAWAAYTKTLEQSEGPTSGIVRVEQEGGVEILNEVACEDSEEEYSGAEKSDEESDQAESDETESEEDNSDSEQGDSSDEYDATPETPDQRVIRDPRHVLREKKKQDAKLAPPKVAIPRDPKSGMSHAKPNKQKRSQKTHAAREVRAWKTEGGW